MTEPSFPIQRTVASEPALRDTKADSPAVSSSEGRRPTRSIRRKGCSDNPPNHSPSRKRPEC
jgi:hypothetical protein